MLNFKKGDFAKIQGQIVKIIDVFTGDGMLKYKVMLLKGRLTSWVKASDIQKIENQKTPKALYSSKAS